MPTAPRHFRRHWFRAVVPAAFAVVMFGLFAYHIPGGAWVAALGLALTLLLCAALHGGIIVSPEGIAWYAVRPAWRYRFVPWDAVRDVRKMLFVFYPLRLVVDDGRREVAIWPNDYAGGDEIEDVIQGFRRLGNTAGEPGLRPTTGCG